MVPFGPNESRSTLDLSEEILERRDQVGLVENNERVRAEQTCMVRTHLRARRRSPRTGAASPTMSTVPTTMAGDDLDLRATRGCRRAGHAASRSAKGDRQDRVRLRRLALRHPRAECLGDLGCLIDNGPTIDDVDEPAGERRLRALARRATPPCRGLSEPGRDIERRHLFSSEEAAKELNSARETASAPRRGRAQRGATSHHALRWRRSPAAVGESHSRMPPCSLEASSRNTPHSMRDNGGSGAMFPAG